MASEVLKWKIWCSTDSRWETVYLPVDDQEPTACPTNTAHTIDASLTSQTTYVKSNDVDAGFPTTSDGRPIFSPAVFGGGQNLNYPGEGDDVAGGKRGVGVPFIVDASVDTIDSNNDIVKEWQFIDNTYIQGGEAEFVNGSKTDKVSMSIYAPATPVVVNTGLGNCNLVAVGPGANIIIPALALDGSHDVDLSAALNANLAAKSKGEPALVTKACPVPAVISQANGPDIPDGYYDYDTATGVLTKAMGPAGEKQGYWNLFDFDVTLVRWVTSMSVWNYGKADLMRQISYRVPVKAKKVLAQWICKATWHVEGVSPTFSGSWLLYTARLYTSD